MSVFIPKSIVPNKQFVDEVWPKVKNTQGLWSELEGQSYEAFSEACAKSDLLIDLGFGMGRITHLVPGHACRVHGVFWSKDVIKNRSVIVFTIYQIATTFRLRRIECCVPSENGAINRFVERLGFCLEGKMKAFYKGRTAFHDANMYSIMF